MNREIIASELVKIAKEMIAGSEKRIDILRRIVNNHQYERIDRIRIDVITANMLIDMYNLLEKRGHNMAKFDQIPLRRLIGLGYKLSEAKTAKKRIAGSEDEILGMDTNALRVFFKKQMVDYFRNMKSKSKPDEDFSNVFLGSLAYNLDEAIQKSTGLKSWEYFEVLKKMGRYNSLFKKSFDEVFGIGAFNKAAENNKRKR